MLFFRRFIHDVLPALLTALAVFIFCLFSFSAGSSTINQRRVLSRSSFTEMFYSAQPFVDPATEARQNSLADFAGVGILKTGERSMSSDIFMVLPTFHYDKTLPFYDARIETLQKGECLVSKNGLEVRHIGIGATLTSNDKDMTPVTVIGELPTIRGFENEHYGVIVMGYDAEFLAFLLSSKPRYVTFSDHRIEDFGMIEVYGHVIPKESLLKDTNKEAIPRMAGAVLTPMLAGFAVGLFTMRNDIRKRVLLIAKGAKKKDIYLYFLSNKVVFTFAPPLIVALLFFLSNLTYISGAFTLFLIIGGSALIATLIQATASIARS